MTRRPGPRRPLLSPAIVLAFALAAGCGGEADGPPAVRVSGTLAVEGKPVTKGTIHFHPEKGRAATGIVQDGKFTLSTYAEGDGAIPGKTKVAVEVVEEVPTKDGDTESKSLIPPKFTNPDRSGIQLDIPAAGYSNLQIDIVGNGVKIKEG